ncbi:Hypothetical predicted protein [Lynx pardinus]|uniref:Integrase catalytic domain-containing protein n=1 Tax=Lynx pardinus TaxID=191816 RepID=A0A485NQY6_LYNPA|nr:Hypothetical predicted protein [Lynx pardinus]
MEIFGRDVHNIIPYNKNQLQDLIESNENWQIALSDFRGEILFHLPKNPIFLPPVIFLEKCKSSPIPNASLVFTDGSSNGKAVAIIDYHPHIQETQETSGMPLHLKTDNAPTYTSKAFKQFSNTFNIKHTTGIPYNPQGQAIVERAHQTLKHQTTKLQEGELKYSSPHHILSHAMFVINNFNVDTAGISATQCHWNPDLDAPKPLDSDSPLWIPDRLIRHVQPATTSSIFPHIDSTQEMSIGGEPRRTTDISHERTSPSRRLATAETNSDATAQTDPSDSRQQSTSMGPNKETDE